MTAEAPNVGDSVLVRRDENQVPGVVLEVEDTQILVQMSESYARETNQPNGGQVWYPLEYVTRLLDDSNPRNELPG